MIFIRIYIYLFILSVFYTTDIFLNIENESISAGFYFREFVFLSRR
jgi:hypothetical protein